MARQSRQPSRTGIYHVMMRGINHQNISYNKLNDLVNTPLSNDVACLDLEDTKRSVLIELKGMRASLRQLERLTGIGKSMIFRM